MSVTTTSNVTTQGVIRLLADYELTHSGDDQGAADPRVNARQRAPTRSNPGWWPTDHYGIPPHRPIDHTLDREQRPWGASPVEVAFVWTMINGVGIVAVSDTAPRDDGQGLRAQCVSKVWRQTGGRINDGMFRFSIGGER